MSVFAGAATTRFRGDSFAGTCSTPSGFLHNTRHNAIETKQTNCDADTNKQSTKASRTASLCLYLQGLRQHASAGIPLRVLAPQRRVSCTTQGTMQAIETTQTNCDADATKRSKQNIPYVVVVSVFSVLSVSALAAATVAAVPLSVVDLF